MVMEMSREAVRQDTYKVPKSLDECYERYAGTIWSILCRRKFTEEIKQKILLETFQQLWIQSKGIKITGLLVVSILKERILFYEQR